MTGSLTLCGDDDGHEALAEAQILLLRGVDQKVTGHLKPAASEAAHQAAWSDWLAVHELPIKHAMVATYQAVQAFDVKDIVKATQLLDVTGGDDLTEALFGSMNGARHQRLLAKLETAQSSTSVVIPPAIAFAVKGALFNTNIAGTQLTYFHHEWRASAGGLLRRHGASLKTFLETAAHRALLRLEWPPSLDSEQPYSIFQCHG
jgi:hypothetical protein